MTQTTAATAGTKKPSQSQLEPAVAPTSVPQPPSTDVIQIIRARAYQLFELRGKEEGHAEEDWLQAESEVLGLQSNKAAA